MTERITKLHIQRQAERLSRNLGVKVAAGQSDYKIWRCHVGGNADTQGNGYTIAVEATARELYNSMYAANAAVEFLALELLQAHGVGDDARHGGIPRKM